MLTIVSGLPRSGTSLMMRMLEAGGLPLVVDNLRAADEDNPRGYFEWEDVKRIREDRAFLDRAEGKVFKMVSQLLKDLPPERDARIVFMRRDLDEMIASQNKMLARSGKPPADARAMATIYEKHLAGIRSWLASRPRTAVIEIDYNGLVVDPDPGIRALNEFFGGSLDTAKMRAVVEPGLYRNRKG